MEADSGYEQGYFFAGFTIEAVFIVPIVFYIVILLIYMNFYLHDYNILIAKADYIIEKYIETKDDGLIQEDALSKYLNKGLWFSKIDNISVDKFLLQLRIKADISLVLPDVGIFNIFSNIIFNNTYEKEFWLIDRTETAKIFTVGLDALEKIEDLKDIIDKYIK